MKSATTRLRDNADKCKMVEKSSAAEENEGNRAEKREAGEREKETGETERKSRP